MIRDTSPEAESFLIRLLRSKSPRAKLALIDACFTTARTLVIAGIRQRHPTTQAAEIESRYLAITLGADLAAKVLEGRRARHGDRPLPSGLDGANAA